MRRPLAALLMVLAASCSGEYAAPVFAAPHVLTGSWIGNSDEHSVIMNLSVRDSTRSDPSGLIPSKFVRGSGRYAVFATGAETTYVIPPYEVRLQSQLEPFTFGMFSYTNAAGDVLRFEYRGEILTQSRLSGWLIRTRTPAAGAVTLDSATLVMIRDVL